VGGTESARVLPVPMMNIINGGEHADNPIDIQEFMIMPVSGAESIADAVRMGAEVFHTLKKELSAAGLSTPTSGDEGGFAPNLPSTREALDFIMKSIEKAGYKAGEDIYAGARCAATEFYKGKYELAGEGKTLTLVRERAQYLAALVKPTIRSSRSRTACTRTTGTGWKLLTELGRPRAAGGRRPVRHQPQAAGRWASKGAANSILVKVNQIGTLTETLAAVDMAHRNGYTASCPTARARPRTPPSPTSPWRPIAGRSRPARWRAPTGWQSTTS
jgi:enolase